MKIERYNKLNENEQLMVGKTLIKTNKLFYSSEYSFKEANKENNLFFTGIENNKLLCSIALKLNKNEMGYIYRNIKCPKNLFGKLILKFLEDPEVKGNFNSNDIQSYVVEDNIASIKFHKKFGENVGFHISQFTGKKVLHFAIDYGKMRNYALSLLQL